MPETTKISVSQYNSVINQVIAAMEKLQAIDEDLLTPAEIAFLTKADLNLCDLSLALRRRTDLSAA